MTRGAIRHRFGLLVLVGYVALVWLAAPLALAACAAPVAAFFLPTPPRDALLLATWDEVILAAQRSCER